MTTSKMGLFFQISSKRRDRRATHAAGFVFSPLLTVGSKRNCASRRQWVRFSNASHAPKPFRPIGFVFSRRTGMGSKRNLTRPAAWRANWLCFCKPAHIVKPPRPLGFVCSPQPEMGSKRRNASFFLPHWLRFSKSGRMDDPCHRVRSVFSTFLNSTKVQ